MATESALTTKMNAGDLSLGRGPTIKMVTGNQGPMTKTVKENQKDLQTKRVAENPSQTTKMVTESALTTKMATESALTTKMNAGDLDLGPGPTIKMVTGNQDPMTKMVKENQKDLQTKRVAGNPGQTTKMVAGDLSPMVTGNPGQTTKMVTESALTTR